MARPGYRLLFVLIALAAAGLAFYFSGQEGAESHRISGEWAQTLLHLFGVTKETIPLSDWDHLVRKLAHLALYFCLGIGLTGAARIFSKGLRRGCAVLFLGLAAASLDELHQLFVQARGASVWDVLLDTAGIAAGYLVYCAAASLPIIFRKLRG